MELTESKSTNVLVIDVQPAYRRLATPIIKPLIQFLNNQSGRIVAIYNDAEMTEDNITTVKSWWSQNGGSRSLVRNRTEWMEKQYGYFRGWMDSDISDAIIVKMIRAMIIANKNDSRSLSKEDIMTAIGHANTQDLVRKYGSMEDFLGGDNLYLPEFLPKLPGSNYLPSKGVVSMLRQLSPFYMVGGGRNECLREIELLCNAFNIRYKRIDQFVYG